MTKGYDITGGLTLPSTAKYYYNGILTGSANGNNSWLLIHRSRPSTKRNLKSASGWRDPSAYYRRQEQYTAGMPGIWKIHGIPGGASGGSAFTKVYTNCYGSGCRQISLILPPPSMEDQAIIKALGKLKAQNVNLSVCFGERKEAAEMMVNTIKSIATTVRRFKGRHPKDWAKVIKNQVTKRSADGSSGGLHLSDAVRDIPNRWLEVQYGWKPTLQDLHGAVEALNKRERDGDAYRATVKATSQFRGRRVENIVLYSGQEFRVVVDYSYGYHVRLDYQLENPLLATLAQLGITNPAVLVWELVPYSFVVDWLLPIGDYLSSFDAALGWDFKAGTVTAFARQQGVSPSFPKIGKDYRGRDDLLQSLGTGRYIVRDLRFERSLYNSSPLPRFPGIKNPLSSGHIANAMALLVSAFR